MYIRQEKPSSIARQPMSITGVSLRSINLCHIFQERTDKRSQEFVYLCV